MTTSPLIRTLIIYHRRLFGETVAALLSRQETIMLVSSATGPSEAQDKLRSLPVDVVLIDTTMEKADAIKMIWEIKEELPNVKLVLLSLAHQRQDIVDFIEAGASGYVLEEASSTELVHTIEAVHHGQTPCSPRIAASVAARIRELSVERDHEESLQGIVLTLREKDILRLLAVGLGNKAIADQLGITLYTVKSHVHNILNKFGVQYRREAVFCAYKSGMLR